METVLLATDLTPSTRAVATCAARLAKAMRAKLEIVHVVGPALAPPPDIHPTPYLEEQRVAATKMVERLAEEMQGLGAQAQGTLRVGIPDEEILRCAHEMKVSLIVLGTHGRPALERAFLGSVAERTVRRSACPVLVLPVGGGALATWTEDRPLQITCAISLSRATDAALGVLKRLSARIRCDTRLIHLYRVPREHGCLGLEGPDPWEPGEGAVEGLSRELGARVTATLGEHATVPIRVRPVWGTEDNPLAWEAETDDADVLLIGVKQDGREPAAIDVLRGANVAVLCVPAQLAPAHRGPLKPIREVLVTTDFSALGNAAIPEAYRLVIHGGIVTLVHVPDTGKKLEPGYKDEVETDLLGLVPRGANPHTVRTRVLVLENASPAEGIVQAINRVGPDVVVMSSHGRTGLDRALRGSVTELVTRDSPKPVLVVPRERDGAEI